MLKTAEKYGKSQGTKDITNDKYDASWWQKINKAQWEDYGNAQGADTVVKVYTGSVNRPKNPTKVTSVTVRNQGTSPITITPGSTATLPVVSSNLYDCTTWQYYPDPTAYDYYGYKASTHISATEAKTVLAQSGSTAVQNFAFDGMEDID